ncbi:siderophore-interacting protein [Frigidibacter mobilis]|uniref:Siderophore-interacting protein n=1 Tax=Frigidibacter mobilis TaxID=1335048 RepID=A0A159Z1F9_9RHOB|nr:siderophore-interacting protein [Frigidibacter mobilis]AMY68757.1 siderophore-interacting protein [Frigidibacter mobilis]
MQRSLTQFPCTDAPGLVAFWRAEFIEHEVPPQEPEPGVVLADAGFARVTVRAFDGIGEIEVACDDPGVMVDLRSGIDEHMAEFAPTLPPLIWTGAGEAGALPPTFAEARVAGCERVGASWLRMVLTLDPQHLPRFAGAHWHFRLLRPATPGRAPVWPVLNARGTINWPKGEDALLDRVYTVQDLDPGAGTISFDIFRHAGGRTSAWAEALPLNEVVGVMGPGGKAGPEVGAPGDWLLCGGDETALPAILRGIAALPEGTCGRAVLLVGDAADRQPAAARGLDITWLFRSEGATEADLVAALTADSVPAGDTWLWFAASQQAARAVRLHGRDGLMLARDRLSSTAYWQ